MDEERTGDITPHALTLILWAMGQRVTSDDVMAQIQLAQQRRRRKKTTTTTPSTTHDDTGTGTICTGTAVSRSGMVDIDMMLDIVRHQPWQRRDNNDNHHGNDNSREELQRTFCLFDVDGTGIITKDNLKRIAIELGEFADGASSANDTGADEDMLQSMIEAFDRDLRGGVTFDDFCRIMGCP